MTNLLHSAFLLLDSIFYGSENVGYTRAEFKVVLTKKNLPHSSTAITRVLDYIDKQYKLRLKFGRQSGCYIDPESSDPNALENINFYKTLFVKDHLYRMMNEYQFTGDIMSFTFETENKNIHLLPEILTSVLNRNYIAFNYKKFHENTFKSFTVAPIYIKEYLNRFYILAYTEGKYKIFSLDRMHDFELLHRQHNIKAKAKKEFFKNTIGVNYSGDLINVRLWTDKHQYHFFETLPLHPSQKLEEETNDGFIFSLRVTLNYELERWILYYGSRVKVLDPPELKEKIKYEMEIALSRYN